MKNPRSFAASRFFSTKKCRTSQLHRNFDAKKSPGRWSNSFPGSLQERHAKNNGWFWKTSWDRHLCNPKPTIATMPQFQPWSRCMPEAPILHEPCSLFITTSTANPVSYTTQRSAHGATTTSLQWIKVKPRAPPGKDHVSHPNGKRKIIFKRALVGDMLVSRRVFFSAYWNSSNSCLFSFNDSMLARNYELCLRKMWGWQWLVFRANFDVKKRPHWTSKSVAHVFIHGFLLTFFPSYLSFAQYLSDLRKTGTYCCQNLNPQLREKTKLLIQCVCSSSYCGFRRWYGRLALAKHLLPKWVYRFCRAMPAMHKNQERNPSPLTLEDLKNIPQMNIEQEG